MGKTEGPGEEPEKRDVRPLLPESALFYPRWPLFTCGKRAGALDRKDPGPLKPQKISYPPQRPLTHTHGGRLLTGTTLFERAAASDDGTLSRGHRDIDYPRASCTKSSVHPSTDALPVARSVAQLTGAFNRALSGGFATSTRCRLVTCAHAHLGVRRGTYARRCPSRGKTPRLSGGSASGGKTLCRSLGSCFSEGLVFSFSATFSFLCRF